jgi:integrase
MEILVSLMCRAEVSTPHGDGRLGSRTIDSIKSADIEGVRTWRRKQQASGTAHLGRAAGETGTNRLLSRMRHLFKWAVRQGYIDETPFKRGTESMVTISAAKEPPRTRRLDAAIDEEALLTRFATPHLRALIVTALSTGCRLGELLSLQWNQVRRDVAGTASWIELPASKTKDAEARQIPVGQRVRAELEMRRHAVDGTEHPATAFVFGNECGERVRSVRAAWEDAVLKAHGVVPTRVRGKLTPASRVAYRRIDLHFHDLRREFASRLLESGAVLHDVQVLLGHAAITTTSRYIQSTSKRAAEAIDRMERAAGFAHGSHTDEMEAGPNGRETAPEKGRKSLH